MPQIPGITVDQHHPRLRENRPPGSQWVDGFRFTHQRPTRRGQRLKSIHIDASGKVFAVSPQSGSTQRRIAIVSIEGLAKPAVGFRIDAVMNLGPIDANQANL
jgi:hypothetical protein